MLLNRKFGRINLPIRVVLTPLLNATLLLSICFFSQTAVAQTGEPDDLAGLSLKELMKVTISTKTERRLGKVPATVYVYTAKDFREHGWTALSDLIPHIPGVDISNTGSGIFISVRGVPETTVNGSKVVVMIDGHDMSVSTTNSPSAFHGFINQFDLRNADRVEALVGPASVIHGANAFSMIINIITKSAKSVDGVQATFTYGTQNEYIPSAVAAKRFGKFGVFASGVFWRRDSWQRAELLMKIVNNAEQFYSNEKFQDNFIKNYSAHVKVDYDNRYELGYIRTKVDQGVGTNFLNTKVGRKVFDLDMIYLNIDKNLPGDWSYKMLAHFKTGKIDSNATLLLGGFGDPELDIQGPPGPSHRQFRIKSAFKTLAIDNRLLYIFSPQLTFLGGVFLEYSRQTPVAVKVTPLPDEAELPQDPPTKNWDNYALYLQTEWDPADDWSLIAGLRSVYSKEQFPSELLPNFGAVYSPFDKWKMKFNFQRGYRPPSEGEIGNTGSFYLKSEDIRSEIISTYEFTASGNVSKESFFYGTFYHSDVTGLIKRIEITGPNGETVTDANAGNVRINGVEIGGEVAFHKKLSVEGAFNYTDSFDKTIKHASRMIIPYKVNLSLKVRPFPNCSIIIDNYLRFKPTTLPENTVFLGKDAPNWYLTNLNVLVDHVFSIPNLSIALSLRNVFNEKYGLTERRAASLRNPDYHPQELRNALFTVQYGMD